MQRNKVRTTPKQMEILLEFIENHRILISGKTTPIEACNGEVKKLWLEITSILNAIGSGAVKTVDGWKKAWGEWKSHTKKKARDLLQHANQTGGGPASSKTLSTLENRLMTLINWTTVAGIGDLPQAGIAEVELTTVELVEPLVDVTFVEVTDGILQPKKSGKRMRMETEEPVPSTSSQQDVVEETNYTPRSQRKKNKCEQYNLSNFLETLKESEDRRNSREESFVKEFVEFKEIMQKQVSVLQDISNVLQRK